MKKYTIYVLLLTLLFLLLYWSNRNAPVRHRWIPTFSTGDKQPYGAYALDKLLESSLDEYYHCYQSIMDLEEEETLDDYNLLIIANEFYSYEEELDTLFAYIDRGGNALIAANYFSSELEDTLNISTLSNIFSYQNLLDLSLPRPVRSIRCCAPELKDTVYRFPSAFCSRFMERKDYEKDTTFIRSAFVVSETMTNEIISLRYQIGKGNLILACNPLAYTNYAILNDTLNGYVAAHLAYLQNRPLIRTEYYHTGSQGTQSQSEFRELLNKPALKQALYLLAASLLIFMFFTAKRKQRAIPIIRPPANKMLNFVRSIARLYLQKNNNADIISKKYIYRADKLKRKYGVDVINEAHDVKLYNRIASKTGQTPDEIRRLLIELRAIDNDTPVSDDEMMQLIVKMNNI